MEKSTQPIQQHITHFLEYLEVDKGLTSKSQENYSMFLNKFIQFLDNKNISNLKPHELTSQHIWQYKLFLARSRSSNTGQTLKKTTQRYYLIALRGLLNYFTDKDIESLPSDKIKLGKDVDAKQNIKFLSIDQIRKLLESPDTRKIKGLRDRAILETLFSTGLRVAELTSLNISQLDLKQNEMELSITGKGNKTRTVYISKRATDWIKAYLQKRQDNSPALFINLRKQVNIDDEQRLTTRSIERVVKHYVKLTGLPSYTSPHTLRHSYATDLLSQGADLRAIQEFLGHSSIITTQVYTHVTNKQLKDIHKKYHSGNKLDQEK